MGRVIIKINQRKKSAFCWSLLCKFRWNSAIFRDI